MQEQMQAFDCDIKPERCELREGGYYDLAKLIVLREIYLEGKSGFFFLNGVLLRLFCLGAKLRLAGYIRAFGRLVQDKHANTIFWGNRFAL